MVLKLAKDLSACSSCLFYCSFDLTFHIALSGSPAVEMEGDKFCSSVSFGFGPFFKR